MDTVGNARFGAEEWLPGTGLVYFYTISTDQGSGKSAWRVGDRVNLLCVSRKPPSLAEPCDSILVAEAELGSGDLPVGLEWAVLDLVGWPGLKLPLGGADLVFPIENQAQALDSRFTRCGPNWRGGYAVQLSVLSADTTARNRKFGDIVARRAAIQAYRELRWEDAIEWSREVLATNPKDPLWRVLYAGALEQAGWHAAYGRQVGMLSAMGLRPDRADTPPQPAADSSPRERR